MFPIHDRRGRMIAFGGRVMEQGRRPQVPQLARDRAVPQGPRAVRPVAGAPGQPEDRAADRGRRLHGRGLRCSSTASPRRWPRWARRPRRTTPSCCSAMRRTCTSASMATPPAARAGWTALESVLPRMKDGRQAFFLFLPDGEDPDTIVRKEGCRRIRRAPAAGHAAVAVLLRRAHPATSTWPRWTARRGWPSAPSRCWRRFPTAPSAT